EIQLKTDETLVDINTDATTEDEIQEIQEIQLKETDEILTDSLNIVAVAESETVPNDQPQQEIQTEKQPALNLDSPPTPPNLAAPLPKPAMSPSNPVITPKPATPPVTPPPL